MFNVAKTMPFAPSPRHHHVYRWYGYHSQSWVVYGIVLPTLIGFPHEHRKTRPDKKRPSLGYARHPRQWPTVPCRKAAFRLL